MGFLATDQPLLKTNILVIACRTQAKFLLWQNFLAGKMPAAGSQRYMADSLPELAVFLENTRLAV